MLNMDDFSRTLREKGLNVTYQRLIIYKYLLNTASHPTAEEIFRTIRNEYSSISMATVYKTLETLVEYNLIGKVNILHEHARFDGNPNPHHHLICVRCRRIADIHDERLDRLPMVAVDGFEVHNYRIQYEGLCDDCRALEGDGRSGEMEDGVTFCGAQRGKGIRT